MDLAQLLRILRRRAYVAIPVFVIGLTLTVVVTGSIDPEYRVTGALMYLGPSVRSVEQDTGDIELEPENPLLTLGGSLGTVAESAALKLGSQSVRAQFYAEGLIPTYEILADSRTPIMQFEVLSMSPALATATMEAVMTWIEADLETRQAEFGVGLERTISVQRLSERNAASPDWSSRRRAQLLLAASAAIGAVTVTVGVDVLLERRRRRRGKTSTLVDDAQNSSSTLDDLEDHFGADAELDRSSDDSRGPRITAP